MRELDEGMKRIFELMTASELQKPTLHTDGTSFFNHHAAPFRLFCATRTVAFDVPAVRSFTFAEEDHRFGHE